jgi:hypothetical protein
VEVLPDDDVVAIRAESKFASTPERNGRQDYHVAERSYDRIVRSFRLPFSPEPQQVDAVLQNGLLTLRVAKPQTVQDEVRAIPVRTEQTQRQIRTRKPTSGLQMKELSRRERRRRRTPRSAKLGLIEL